MKCCINGENNIGLLLLSAKLFKFEIQKCSQILCAHKPYFLMLGHIYVLYVRRCIINALLRVSEKVNKDSSTLAHKAFTTFAYAIPTEAHVEILF